MRNSRFERTYYYFYLIYKLDFLLLFTQLVFFDAKSYGIFYKNKHTHFVYYIEDFKLKLLIEFNFEAPTFRNLFQINTSIKYNDSTKDDPFGGFEISVRNSFILIYH